MSPRVGCAGELGAHPSLPESFKYVWLEGGMKARLDLLSRVPDWNDLLTWPAGRVFGSDGEYRWQARIIGWPVHAVVILDTNFHLEGFDEWIEVSLAEEEPCADLILWGDWIEPGADPEANPEGGPRFYAREIPGVLEYPLDGQSPDRPGETPRLSVRRYRSAQHGEFIRCTGFRMKGEDGPNYGGRGGQE